MRAAAVPHGPVAPGADTGAIARDVGAAGGERVTWERVAQASAAGGTGPAGATA